jgi:hypothetical protein
VFDTNVVVVRVTQAALPSLRKSDNPVVVNISSALGSFWAVTNPGAPAVALRLCRVWGEQGGGLDAHGPVRQSAAGDQVQRGPTRLHHHRLQRRLPGGQPVEESTEVIVRMATIRKDGPTGTFQEDDHELAWWGRVTAARKEAALARSGRLP